MEGDLIPGADRAASTRIVTAPGKTLSLGTGTVLVVIALAAAVGVWTGEARSGGSLQTWSTLFVSVTIQALPFLVLGVVVSGAITAFVPPGRLAAFLPRTAAFSVPAASLAGALLPGCECGSVPIAGRMVDAKVSAAPALAFMLAAPAVNPVVLVATAVAFPGRPVMVLARFLGSLVTAVVVGWLWSRFGRAEWMQRPAVFDEPAPPARVFADTARHDLAHAGGFLVVGAAAAATLRVFVPGRALDIVGGSGPAAVPALALLAVLLAVCSEADAFVAASLTGASPTAQLAFMVVGPAVDVKLAAMQAGVFGRRFAARFAPATFVVALVAAALVGKLLL